MFMRWGYGHRVGGGLEPASPVLSIGKEETLGSRGKVGQAGAVNVVGLLKCCELPMDMCNVFIRLTAGLVHHWQACHWWCVSLVSQLCQKYAHGEGTRANVLLFCPVYHPKSEGQHIVDPLLQTIRWLVRLKPRDKGYEIRNRAYLILSTSTHPRWMGTLWLF